MSHDREKDEQAAMSPPSHSCWRKMRVAIAVILVLLAVVLWWWHPWRKPIKSIKPISIVERINPKDGATMVWVPAGEFRMGREVTLQERFALNYEPLGSDQPAHTVYLDGYWIYKYEVTVAQYRAFCRATGRKMPQKPAWGWHDDHPIVNVTWLDAAAYAKWAGVALPTEAQWEKAARGTDKRLFPWGNTWDINRCANIENSNGTPGNPKSTRPVGSYPSGASPYGALDMAGNAWEFCADWYEMEYYLTSPSRNPTGGAASAGFRSMRGGSWGNYGVEGGFIGIGCVCRDEFWPTNCDNHIGFRCSSSASGP